MSLFQCEHCGCCENTALAFQGFKMMAHLFDWTYAPDRKGKLLCSACGPGVYASGDETKRAGKWHNEFARVFLPLGEFKTNARGNLEHIATGSTDYRAFAIPAPAEILKEIEATAAAAVKPVGRAPIFGTIGHVSTSRYARTTLVGAISSELLKRQK